MSSGIPVKTFLDAPTFKRLEKVAGQHGVTIGELLAWGGRRMVGTDGGARPRPVTNKLGATRAADDTMVDAWVAAVEQGMSNTQIALKWHVSTQLVSKRLLERGIRRRSRATA